MGISVGVSTSEECNKTVLESNLGYVHVAIANEREVLASDVFPCQPSLSHVATKGRMIDQMY